MRYILLALLILGLSGSINQVDAQLITEVEHCAEADFSLYKYKYKTGLTQADAVIYWVDSIAQARFKLTDGRWKQSNNGVKVCYKQHMWDADFTIYVTSDISRATVKNDKLLKLLRSQ